MTRELSLRNQDRKIVKAETETINELLTYILTNNMTELNELIYTGAKLVCNNIDVPLKNTNRNSKPGWEIWLEMQKKYLRQKVKMIRENTLKHVRTKRKSNTTSKTNNITDGNKSEGIGERMETKNIPRQDPHLSKKTRSFDD